MTDNPNITHDPDALTWTATLTVEGFLGRDVAEAWLAAAPHALRLLHELEWVLDEAGEWVWSDADKATLLKIWLYDSTVQELRALIAQARGEKDEANP